MVFNRNLNKKFLIIINIIQKYLYSLSFLFFLSISSAYAEQTLFSFDDPNSNLIGYVNQEGEIVIKPQFESASDFSEGFAWVRKPNDKYRFVNTSGEFLKGIQSVFVERPGFSEGLAIIASFVDNEHNQIKLGYVNKDGKIIIPYIFDWAHYFRDGLALVKKNGKSGYINHSGDFVIEAKYDWAHWFTEGLAAVKVGDKFGYINKEGKFVISPNFGPTYGFSEGLATVETDQKLTGFIDKAGNFVIQPQFRSASNFSEGMAVVRTGAGYGYINKTGEFVIQPRFYEAYDFSDSMALVCKKPKKDFLTSFFADTSHLKGPCGYINKSGDLLIPMIYSSASYFKNGRAFVTLPAKESQDQGSFARHNPNKDDQRGLIDKNGRFILIH